MVDKVPVLKIEISVVESGDVQETLYTDAPLFDVCAALHAHSVVFDTPEELANAREENDRG